MIQSPLRAIVIGAGWAGEGHVKALQRCGVDVAAICARDQAVVQAVADRLQVPLASTDWRTTLAQVKPQIASLATPAALRTEVIEAAVAQGCHILCEKPLAVDTPTAQRLYKLVQGAGVKHALGTVFYNAPCVAWVRELLRDGAIGTLREIHCLQSGPFFPINAPWGWQSMLEQGGGVLNNGAIHLFALWERILGGRLQRVSGTARALYNRAPVVPGVHDYRHLYVTAPSAEAAAGLAWRPTDADDTCTFMAECATDLGGETAVVPILAHLNIRAHTLSPTNGWYFYGDEGILVGNGVFTFTVAKQAGNAVSNLPVPQRLLDALPQTGNELEDLWTSWVDDVLADLQQENGVVYPTFADGWRYQAAIDAIRQGSGWYVLE